MSTPQAIVIPQPKPAPLLGNVVNIDPKGPVQSLMALARRYGPIFKMQMPAQTMYVLSSQELVNEICDEQRFDKRVHNALRKIRDFAGDALFTAYTHEPNWELAHRLLMPAFGAAALRDMFDPMLDIADQMLVKWQRQGEQFRIDVSGDMTRLTLDTIALCAFDYRFNSFYEPQMHPFIGAMVRSLKEAGARARRLPIHTRLMLMTQRQYAEDIRYMHEIADELIAERHKQPAYGNDLLGRMLAARDPQTGQGLSDVNVRYQMVTFLIAGHETTSGLLSFTLHELLKHPQALARARAEVDDVLGSREPRFEDLSKLVYIDQVLKESLRLWPTAPVFAVYPYEDGTLGEAKYPVNKQLSLMALLPSLHRDPKVWGADAERFDPDRMAPEAFSRLPPNAWKPFGNGQRACIGRPFAMQEATLVIATMLQRFDLLPADPDYTLKIKETLTLKPEGLYIRARKRNRVILRSVPKPAQPATAAVAGTQQTAAVGTRLQVLFGSNSGSAESLAQKIATDAKAQGYLPTLAALDTAVDQLPKEGATIIVTASYEGEPPDNARAFVSWLDTLEPGSLEGVRYVVFGCGNRDWARTYQAIPTKVDRRLAECGAQRLVERGEADARGDFFGDFDRWYEPFWTRVGAVFGQQARAASSLPLFEIEFVAGARDSVMRQNNLSLGEVVENRELVDMSSPLGRSKRHLEVKLPPGAKYRAGDYLAVLPVNPPESIDRALRRFGLSYDARVVIHMQPGVQTFFPVNQPITAGELLSSYVELGQAATRNQIEQLAVSIPCPPEKRGLEALVANDEVYAREVLDQRVSVLDLLERYASCALSFASFLQMLPPLRPRQYSISSSPLWSEEHCTITCAVVNAPAWSGHGNYRGVASNYLGQIRPGAKIAVMTRASHPAFHLPDTQLTPIIMVAAGTGLAPFRGFLQERALLAQSGTQIGPALLYFGCDHPAVDYLYRDELQAWEQDRVVSLRPTFCEAPEDGLVYVQHRLWKERAEIMALVDQGARIYVCGEGKRMAPAVRETFGRMYQERAGASAEQVETWLSELERSIRYVVDVFA